MTVAVVVVGVGVVVVVLVAVSVVAAVQNLCDPKTRSLDLDSFSLK